MFRLNKKLEYALIALKHMSEKVPGELTSAKEISETYHSPFDATARVLQIMAQNQILKSEQGSQGGYLIQKDLTRISLLRLMEMILGPQHTAACMCSDTECDLSEHCNIVPHLTLLEERIRSFYDGINIKEIILCDEFRRSRISPSSSETRSAP